MDELKVNFSERKVHDRLKPKVQGKKIMLRLKVVKAHIAQKFKTGFQVKFR